LGIPIFLIKGAYLLLSRTILNPSCGGFNSGNRAKHKKPGRKCLKVNLGAADEISKTTTPLRGDMGGIIVIDFIR